MMHSMATIRMRKRVEWAERAAGDKNRFIADAPHLGLDASYLANAYEKLYQLAEAEAQAYRRSLEEERHWGVGPPPPDTEAFEHWAAERLQRSLAQRIIDFFSDREFRVEHAARVTIVVPLFRLYAPGPSGSEAVYEQLSTELTSGGWWVTVFGTGIGADQELEVEEKGAVTATDDEAKLISVPLTVLVSKIGVYQGKRKVGEGHSLELDSNQKQRVRFRSETIPRRGIPGPALKDVRPMAWELKRDRGKKSTTASVSLSTYHKSKVSFGIEQFGIKMSGQGEVSNQRDVKVSMVLPNGYDYVMKWITSPLGISWSVV